MRNPAPTRSGRKGQRTSTTMATVIRLPTFFMCNTSRRHRLRRLTPPRNSAETEMLLIPRLASFPPHFSETASTNQGVLHALADGTGGFIIPEQFNDLLGGMERIAKEQNESPHSCVHSLRIRPIVTATS